MMSGGKNTDSSVETGYTSLWRNSTRITYKTKNMLKQDGGNRN
jgi:hypothetical protein